MIPNQIIYEGGIKMNHTNQTGIRKRSVMPIEENES